MNSIHFDTIAISQNRSEEEKIFSFRFFLSNYFDFIHISQYILTEILYPTSLSSFQSDWSSVFLSYYTNLDGDVCMLFFFFFFFFVSFFASSCSLVSLLFGLPELFQKYEYIPQYKNEKSAIVMRSSFASRLDRFLKFLANLQRCCMKSFEMNNEV